MELEVIIPFLAYFLLMIGIGVFSARFSSKGISEYFLAGRKMNYFVVALSAVVSGRSAWLLLGFTGLAYTVGFSAIWTALGYIVVELLLFLFYAPRIREFTEEHDCITIPDFFAARFGGNEKLLRILLVSILIIFMITYVAAQFVAGGKAFASYFDISAVTGLIITAVIVLIYTVLGGFLAVSITDMLQALFMIFILIALPLTGILNVGGWDVISLELMDTVQLQANGQVLSETAGEFLNPFSLSAIGIISGLGIGLGSPGNPHIIVRYMSIKKPEQFKWTAIVGTVWNVLMAGGALFIGIVGRAYIQEVNMLPHNDVESIYIALAQQLLNPVLIGLLLASIFAAIMSTADSQLLVGASSIVRDIYEKIIRRNSELSSRELAFLSRFVVIILVVIATFLGIFIEELVFWLVLFAWAGLGAAIGPTSILALFWKKTTRNGVIAGWITGTATVFIWKLVPELNALVYELVPAFTISLLFTIAVSLIDNQLSTKKNNKTD